MIGKKLNDFLPKTTLAATFIIDMYNIQSSLLSGLLLPVIRLQVDSVTQINQPTRCNNLSSLLLDVYLQLNMFRASSRPSLGAQQLQ
jgi:hypothetical protein